MYLFCLVCILYSHLFIHKYYIFIICVLLPSFYQCTGSFCHQDKFTVRVSILNNKAHSVSDLLSALVLPICLYHYLHRCIILKVKVYNFSTTSIIKQNCKYNDCFLNGIPEYSLIYHWSDQCYI